jgi:phage N-6-adenine-methyltransferase
MTISKVVSQVPLNLRDEWRTPPELFELLDKEFNFTCDVAATNKDSLCQFYLKDALGPDPWMSANPHINYSPFFFMNPPGSQTPAFLARANREAERGATVVCLVRASGPETEWWQDAVLEITESPLDGSQPMPSDPTYWYTTKHEVWYLKPRVQYLLPSWEGPGNRADFPSCLIIMRPYPVYGVVKWWRWK